MEKLPLVILAGPTAVGKTSLSLQLAHRINGAIISADSMQVYRKMDIGTAKLRPEEREGIVHYLIDEIEPDQEFHVVQFQKLAKQYMKEIYSKNKIPILVGGTGFYIQAVLYDIDFADTREDSSYRKSLEALALEKGAEYLYEELSRIDPKAAAAIHPHNQKRVIRALEYYQQTGACISEHNERQRKKISPYQFAYFVLTDERARLYERINQRVDQMMQDGLLEEVQNLQKQGYSTQLVSMQGLGYKEILDYLSGTCTLAETVEQIKRNTRHFAKRQLTWFKREPEVIWMNKAEWQTEEALLEQMLSILHHRIHCPTMD